MLRVRLSILYRYKYQRGSMEKLIHFINTYARLSFPNRFLEKQYQKEHLNKFLPQNIMVAKIAIFIYLTYVPLTYFLLLKNELFLLSAISALGIFGSLLLVILVSQPIFKKHPHLVLFMAAYLVGLAPILYYILTDNNRALFQVDILLPIIGIFTMYGVGFALAFLISFSILISFFILSVIIGIGGFDIFAGLYVLISGGVVTGVAAYFMEKSHRSLFIAKRESDEFSFMVENAQDSIAVFDIKDMRYRYANKIALECTDTDPKSILSKKITDIHPEFTERIIATIKQRLMVEGSFSDVYKLYSNAQNTYYYAHIVFQYGYFKGKKAIITFSSDATPQKEAEIKLHNMALQDALTGLCNRHNFDESSKQQIHLAKRYQQPLTLIICDIDHFKKFNDQFGHLQGDQILQQISARIRESLRESDIAARWGGEEFAILLPNTSLKDAQMVAEKIREQVANLDIEGVGPVTISCGVAQINEEDTQKSWFHRADTALYEAKEAGRDRVRSA